jgi:hypothetical protein
VNDLMETLDNGLLIFEQTMWAIILWHEKDLSAWSHCIFHPYYWIWVYTIKWHLLLSSYFFWCALRF